MANNLVACGLAFFFFFVALPFGCSMLSGSPASKTGIPTLSGPIVTKAEYDQIPTGASYSQVASIVGDPGEQSQRQEMMGFIHTTYMWQNGDGSNLICMFQNDKLINKTQTMLP